VSQGSSPARTFLAGLFRGSRPLLTERVALLGRALLCVASVVLAAYLSAYTPLRALDDRLQDLYTATGPQQPAPAGIVIVDISESSLAALGPWPWPRSTLAQVSDSLRARGARLQVWDLMLPESSAGDSDLASSWSRDDVVVGQVLVTDPRVAQPPQEGQLLPADASVADICSVTSPVVGHLGVAPTVSARMAGHVGATPDADGRLRRLQAVICHQGNSFPQLALAAAQAAEPDKPWRASRGTWPWEPHLWLSRGDWRFPLDENGWIRVPYARDHRTWPAVSVEQVLDTRQPLPELRGSVVLIGSTALGLADIVNTPFYPVAPGVSVHAELVAAARVVDPAGPASAASAVGSWLFEPKGSVWATVLMVLSLGTLLVIRLWPQAPIRGSVLVSAGVVVLPFLTAPMFREAGLMLPVVPATAALIFQACATWLFNAAWLQHQSRILARHLQGFMPEALAREIATRNPTGDSLGHEETGTVMAIRIGGLQRWQSGVAPLRALGLIHGIHAAAQSVCSGFGGRLEHAQGHLLLSAWPHSKGQGAEMAVAAARRCLKELQPLLDRNETESCPLSMSIAIESGPYLHGIVGHADSRSALLLGAAVTDVYAMLELSDELACPMMVGPIAAASLDRESTEVLGIGHFVLPAQVTPKELFRIRTAPGLSTGVSLE